MYENMTFENIEESMLSRVREDIDKREGSIIWDATAPVAYKLAEIYFLLQNYPDLVFPDTSIDKFLERFVKAHNLSRKEAVAAIRKVCATESIEIGSRWQIDDVTYRITNMITETEYMAECEQAGQIGNRYYGELAPIDGTTQATVTIEKVLTAGADEETDEELRSRFFAKVRRPATSGNVNDYYNWVMECAGVGAAKIFPLANGPGTVKVVVANEDKQAAGEALLYSVAEHIEELRPIGATVSVVSAVEKKLNISAVVKITQEEKLNAIQSNFQNAVDTYLQENAFHTSYISLARIGNILIETTGVEDYTDLQLNGVAENLNIQQEEIAVIGTVRLEVQVGGA